MNTVSRSVVVGIIDKQPSALRLAIRQALDTDAVLRVVHSFGLSAQAAGAYAGFVPIDDTRTAGQVVLDDAKDFIDQEGPGLQVEYVLSSAPPIEVLMHESIDAKVLVVGADDVPWFERVFRSRIAGYLARQASCPVVVVPELIHPKVSVGGIVVTLDGDTSAAGPLRFAFEQACVRGEALHVLHAAPPATLESDVEAIRANISEVIAGWRESYPEVEVVQSLALGTPQDAVSEATNHADLVIVGRPHSHTVPFAISRPLAVDVLRRAHCPVAVVPTDYRGA